jgi:uncharacterized protein YlzI (FlbEa/FlbD family)
MFRYIKATRDDGKTILLEMAKADEMEFVPGSPYTTIKFASGETTKVRESPEELRSRLGISN